MAWTKAKTIIVAGVVAVLTVGTVTIVVNETQTRATPKAVAADSGEWIWRPDSQNLERVPAMLVLRPSTLPGSRVPFEMYGKGRYLARGKTLAELLAAVYSQKDSQIRVACSGLPDGKYDCIVTSQPKWWYALETEIDSRFNLRTQYDPQAKSVLVAKRTM